MCRHVPSNLIDPYSLLVSFTSNRPLSTPCLACTMADCRVHQGTSGLALLNPRCHTCTPRVRAQQSKGTNNPARQFRPARPARQIRKANYLLLYYIVVTRRCSCCRRCCCSSLDRAAPPLPMPLRWRLSPSSQPPLTSVGQVHLLISPSSAFPLHVRMQPADVTLG